MPLTSEKNMRFASLFLCLNQNQQAGLWWDAVKQNDVVAVKWITDHTTFDVNTPDPGDANETRAILSAMTARHEDLFDAILASRNIDLNAGTRFLERPVLMAAGIENPRYLSSILFRAKQLIAKKETTPPLSALFNVPDVTTVAVNSFDINAQNTQGITAFYRACSAGILENVNAILDFPGVNLTAKAYVGARYASARTGYDAAVMGHHWAVVDRLRSLPEFSGEDTPSPNGGAFFRELTSMGTRARSPDLA